jgi:hypothetical protein
VPSRATVFQQLSLINKFALCCLIHGNLQPSNLG